MKLKSLLLGSAAALIAVSGANAADAVFAAEPEPMEYVKVCDTYGAGFFFIPGTETCLRISGYVRSEMIYTDDPSDVTTTYSTSSVAAGSAAPAGGTLIGTVGGADIYSIASTSPAETTGWGGRGQLRVDARNETDWGQLRSQIRINGNYRGGGGSEVLLDRALISLAGLRVGFSDSWQTTHHGYGWHLFANDGPYGFDQAVMLDYTFAANGFTASIGVQDTSSLTAVATGSDVYDPYGGFSYSGSWGNVAASVIYDSGVDEAVWKVSADVTAIDNLAIRGWYMADDGGTAYVGAGAYQWGVSARYTVNSQFMVAIAYSDVDAANSERYGIAARWNPVNGLSIRPEAIFGDNYTQARLRVVRTF